MRVSRVRATNFRGWSALDLQHTADLVAVGEPRGGRSDLVAALTRVLDPRSTRINPSLTDLHQRLSLPDDPEGPGTTSAQEEPREGAEAPAPATGDTGSSGTPPPVERPEYAEVELTLIELGGDIEQEVPGIAEPVSGDGAVDESSTTSPTATLGLRMTYRITYDAAADTLNHVLYFPSVSNPDSGQFARVPSSLRLLLPVVFLDTSRPLQLRAEGLLRRLLKARDSEAVSTALRTMESRIAEAAGDLSKTAVIADLLNVVLSGDGPARRAGDRPLTADDIKFLPDDGSLAGLLRSIQPLLALDMAGPLPLAGHGSTTSAVLAASEALVLATSFDGAVLIGDDFGEGLDAASAEYLAAAIKAGAEQVWLTTRRSEVARAFDVSEIVRLTRRNGTRIVNRVPRPSNKKEVAVRRHLQTQLLPALTATTVAIVEGRHDLATYSAADRLRQPPAMPLAGYGLRMITADSGEGGGTTQIPRVAELAKALGFRVVALIDRDPAKKSDEIVKAIEEACDAVVRLPDGMGVERALLSGVDATHLRNAAAVMTGLGQPDPTYGRPDADLLEALTKALHRNGLHEAFLSALMAEHSALPPALGKALDHLATVGATDYAGSKRIDIVFNTTGQASIPAGTPNEVAASS